MWFLISLVSGLSRRACSWTWHLPQHVMNIGNTTQRVAWAPAHMWYLDVLIGLHRPTARRDATCEREQTCCSTRTGTDIGTAMSTEVSGDFVLWEGGASPHMVDFWTELKSIHTHMSIYVNLRQFVQHLNHIDQSHITCHMSCLCQC